MSEAHRHGRDPADVIERCLAVIPADEDELRAQLEKIKADSWFFPPEGKAPIWASLAAAFEQRFPRTLRFLPKGWPQTVSNIVRGLE